MTPSDRAQYQGALDALKIAGVRFCVIGSFGLFMRGIELGDYEVKDLDIMIDPGLDNIERCAAMLTALGYLVRVWEEELPVPLTQDFLKGKYYLRATKPGDALLTVDCTYEHDSFPIESMLAGSEPIGADGINVVLLADQIAMKKARGTPRDLELLALVEAATSLSNGIRSLT
jgi:hypothetical protein